MSPARHSQDKGSISRSAAPIPLQPHTVILVDVDNTLLDNDAVVADLKRHLVDSFGVERERRYWHLFEQIFNELGYADYLGALQRYRNDQPNDPHLLGISLFLLHYPFADRLFPGALDVLAELRQRARVVILSDGDVVFQPYKVERSGLWQAVEGEVLIYVHKEQMLDDVERRYPAQHYVMVDDKLRILAAIKETWHDRVTTVFVRQGHYAFDPSILASFPAADVTIERIDQLPETLESGPDRGL
jgi:FMN phosphatase YigB (HAD superfamily)